MTSGSPNTSDFDSFSHPWLVRQQELLVASLQHQPLLLVIRPEPDDLAASGSGLLDQVKQLPAQDFDISKWPGLTSQAGWGSCNGCKTIALV